MPRPSKSNCSRVTRGCAANPTRAFPSVRRRRAAHWDPAGLPAGVEPGLVETAIVSPPVLGSPDEEDRIASAATFGFVIDLAAVEIDRKTGTLRIDKYASVHDVGDSAQSQDRGRADARRLRARPRRARCSRNWPTTRAAISSPAPSPIIFARPRSKCRRSTSAMWRRSRRSMHSAPRAWATAARCSRRPPSPMRSPMRSAVTTSTLPLNLQRLWLMANGKEATLKPRAAAAAEGPAASGGGEGCAHRQRRSGAAGAGRRGVAAADRSRGTRGHRPRLPEPASGRARWLFGAGGDRCRRHQRHLRRHDRDARQAGTTLGPSGRQGFGRARVRLRLRPCHAAGRTGRSYAAALSVQRRCRRQGRGGRPAHARYRHALSDRTILRRAGAAHRARQRPRLARPAGAGLPWFGGGAR